MDRNGQQASHSIKRIVLPSGKTIEVIHFGHDATAPETGELHVCRQCGSQLVHPTCWTEAGQGSWQVTLRCPECETLREGVFTQGAVDAFDEELDSGTEAVAADLRRLTHANMSAEGERFFAALAADAILPEDF